MKKIFLLLTLIFLPLLSHAEVKVVAVVGDDAVSTLDVNERLKLAIFSSGLPPTEEVQQKLAPQVIQLLIDEKLLSQEASRQGIVVDQKEIDDAVKNLEEKNKIAVGGFPKFLEEHGLNIATLRNQLEAQIIRTRLLNQKIRSNVVITEGEIQEKIENISANSGLAELNISEIAIPIDKPANEKQAATLAKDLVNQIRGGKKFEDIARQFSRSTSAEEGGKLGWIDQGQLAPEVLAKVKHLQKNQVSDPVRTADGYYIIRLNDRRAFVATPEKETEIGLKQVFVPLTKEGNKKAILKTIKNTKQAVKGCGDFSGFAKKAGSSISPEMVMTQVKELNDDIYQVVKDLPIGKVSPTIQSAKGLHVFMVCEKTQAAPGLAQRKRIQDIIYREKAGLLSKRLIRDLRRSTYIEIRA